MIEYKNYERDERSNVMLDHVQQMMTCVHEREEKLKGSSSEVQAIENSFCLFYNHHQTICSAQSQTAD
jgi:hypothetical protein